MSPTLSNNTREAPTPTLASASMRSPLPDPQSAPPVRNPLEEGPRSVKDVAAQIQANPRPEKIVGLLEGLPEKLSTPKNIENIREQLTKTLGEDRMLSILKQATPEQREKMAPAFLGVHAAADAAHLKETLASAQGKGDAALKEAQLEFVRDVRSDARAARGSNVKAENEQARDRVFGAAAYYNLIGKDAEAPDVAGSKLLSIVAAEERREAMEKAAIETAEKQAKEAERARRREERERERAEHHK